MTCLCALLKEEDGYDDTDTSEKQLNTTDCGGLYHITDSTFEFFMELELLSCNLLTTTDIYNMQKSIIEDPNVSMAWADCGAIYFDDIDKQNSLLHEIVKMYTKMCGHSVASMEMEKFKKKKVDTTKKRRLRKELRRQNETINEEN